MQTNTWIPEGATPARALSTGPARPSWVEVYGWFAAGGGVTVGFWLLAGGFVGAMHAWRGADALSPLLFGLEIALLVKLGRGRHRRCKIALVLGAVLPAILLGLLLLWLIWSFSHWQF